MTNNKILLVFTFFFILFSCKKEKSVEKDVYVVGQESNAQHIPVAKVWKNGEPFQILTDGSEISWATDLKITNNGDIYVVGVERSSNNYPLLWKNGSRTELSFPASYDGGYANAVFVLNNDVYVAGNIYKHPDIGQFHYTAVLWKNGNLIYLTAQNGESEALNVFAVNQDVYVAGYEQNSNEIDVAKIWKNGTETILSTGGVGAVARSVFVHNSDVYVVGTDDNAVTLWKNGVPERLTDGTLYGDGQEVKVIGNDVYVVGSEGYALKYWKNGIPTNITNGLEHYGRGSIDIDGEDIYVASYKYPDTGFSIPVAKVWKNGVEQAVTLESPTGSSVLDAVVVH